MNKSEEAPISKAVWEPIPNTSQALALDSRCHHTLYTGNRGPGKTDTQLMKFRKYVGVGYGHFWRGVIFDREYKNLDDLISKSRRWFPKFEDGARFLSSNKDLKWIWPTGEELLFRAIKDKEDYWQYHGQEFPFIGWNELTKYPAPDLYESMMSCNRSSFTPEKDGPEDEEGNVQIIPKIPLIVFATTNPYGAGHNWVKKKFITPAPIGTVVKHKSTVFNPGTQREEEIVKTQVAIQGNYKENIYLSADYVAELEKISDPQKRAAWLFGSWDIPGGGAIDDLWDRRVHVVPRFAIPEGWYLDRAFDWGSSHPYSVGWFAEANGEEAVLPDGTVFCPPRGTLIQFAEEYGAEEVGTNIGKKLSAKDIAKIIKKKEVSDLLSNRIKKQPSPGPADNQIRNVTERDVDTIEKKMEDEGVKWESSDKSPGSRKNGLQLFRERLEASLFGEGPGIYFMETCPCSIAILPTLPRDEKDPDDIDTDSEDHIWDMVRYRVLKSSNRFVTELNINFAR